MSLPNPQCYSRRPGWSSGVKIPPRRNKAERQHFSHKSHNHRKTHNTDRWLAYCALLSTLSRHSPVSTLSSLDTSTCITVQYSTLNRRVGCYRTCYRVQYSTVCTTCSSSSVSSKCRDHSDHPRGPSHSQSQSSHSCSHAPMHPLNPAARTALQNVRRSLLLSTVSIHQPPAATTHLRICASTHLQKIHSTLQKKKHKRRRQVE